MEKYQAYQKLSQEIEVLEGKKSLLREEIAKDLPPEGVKNEFVTASWKSNKKWAYSDTIKTLEVKLKEDKTKIETQKEIEEKLGTATFEETKSLVITPKK